MDTIFPFGFPWPTAMYLVLYVVTLVIHVVFMNYVLAGSLYLAVAGLFSSGGAHRDPGPISLLLRDWLPFMVSAAITAGVAPLLFIQILYQHNFYTANLLGFNRWMSILPVLIVAFYLLYLLKARRAEHWPAAVRTGIGVTAFACFGFVAYSWTENYLLSVQNQQTWSRVYLQGTTFYWEPQLLPRLAVWFLGAIPTMVVSISWQLWHAQNRGRAEVGLQARRCAAMALAGLLLTLLSSGVYLLVSDTSTRAAFLGPVARPYLILAAAGLVIQVGAWVPQGQRSAFDARLLGLASAGTLMTILGMTITREAVRIAAVDITRLYARHADTAKVGGLSIFLLFFAINAVLVVWSMRLARHKAPA